VHIVSRNASPALPLPADGRVELAFDRYLLPASISRQTFQLIPAGALLGAVPGGPNVPLAPNVAYDPVARIVTISPLAPLAANQSYRIQIKIPSGPTDPDGLRSIDGATISPPDATIEFPVVAATGGTPPAPTVDFCKDILPVFTSRCAFRPCHAPPVPPAGLRLDSPLSIASTAVGRVAQGANTGPRASDQPPGLVFGEDMPIIDPGSGEGGGNPGNSWLLYKLLLAVPSHSPSAPAATCDGGAAEPTDISTLHLQARSSVPALNDPANDSERATLSDHVLGREMPFPTNPGAPLGPAGLTIDELERVSRWIGQPAGSLGGGDHAPLIPSSCGCIP
jgi:hypothetical protein